MPMEQVLTVNRLAFAYRDAPVLTKVNFSVRTGDFVSLIGGNGAGKSTLLRILLGELQPDRGQIEWFGTPIDRFHSWPMVGYVPQNGGGLVDGFPATVEEVVAMGLYAEIGFLRRMKRSHRERVHEVLRQVGMDTFEKRMAGKLSGGQIQRVLIARAMVGSSRVLLLDEPTTGVDSEAAAALYTLLQKLNREQELTILMVTHDLARSTPYVNRTLCLEEGSLVELDKAQIAHEMQHRHQH